MVYVLFAAVAAGAAIGGVRSLAGPAPSAAAEPVATTESPVGAPFAAEPEAPASETAEASASLEGEVLEVIAVPNYTYLRIGDKGTEGAWAAVPTAQLKVGDHAAVHDAMKMTGFTSTALKRTFPEIYFGTLQSGRAAHANGADPHAAGAASPHANVAGDPAAGADPHASMGGPPASGAEVKPVDKAKGPEGRTVAEVIGQRDKLSGKTVRIHGTVVKSTPGVLGKTYLHLRDGSGDPGAGTNDVTVTTTETPKVGDVVTVEGTVVLDRDIGAGYKFPTLVDDAKVLVAP
jgi:hypothetical protein